MCIRDSLKASGDSPSGNDDLSQLASQLPLMKNLLQEFISYSGFLHARITNADAQTYLSTDVTPPALSLEQQQGIRQTVESGKLSILPVRKTSNGLVLDLVVPIFAPQYVENRSEKPVATLLLSLICLLYTSGFGVEDPAQSADEDGEPHDDRHQPDERPDGHGEDLGQQERRPLDDRRAV